MAPKQRESRAARLGKVTPRKFLSRTQKSLEAKPSPQANLLSAGKITGPQFPESDEYVVRKTSRLLTVYQVCLHGDRSPRPPSPVEESNRPQPDFECGGRWIIKGLHPDRIAGRHCHHRHPGRDALTRSGRREGERATRGLPQ